MAVYQMGKAYATVSLAKGITRYTHREEFPINNKYLEAFFIEDNLYGKISDVTLGASLG